MTTTLVDRLRQQGTDCDWNGVDGGAQLDPLLHEAADEIKRLSAEVERLRKDADMLRVSNDKLVHDLDRAAENAARYQWLRDNKQWSVSYRIKPRNGIIEWRMRNDGEYWGSWWPTHEQAVDHARKEQR